jgi:hypothetical protein
MSDDLDNDPEPLAPTPASLDEPQTPSHRIGYRSPPLHSRFAKGVSGNPKGRPKGARGFRNIFRGALEQKVTVQDRDGRTRRRRAIDVIVQREIAKALKGEDKALTRVQTQARAIDLEDELKAAVHSGDELSKREREILAHYAPDLLAALAPQGAPPPKKQENPNDESK